MAKFVFRLEALLNLKNQMENNLKNDLGKEIKKLEFEKNKLLKILEEEEEYFANYRKQSKDGATISIYCLYNNYYAVIKKRIEFQKKTINEFEKSVDIIRGKLIKVVQEKKMIEKLKEKEFEKFKKEQLIIEQKTSEEIYAYKFIERKKD